LRIAPLGRAEGAAAGSWRRHFAERARTLSQADCLIAAAAVSLDARLATGNLKDFPMADVLVEDWPAGREGRSAAGRGTVPMRAFLSVRRDPRASRAAADHAADGGAFGRG